MSIGSNLLMVVLLPSESLYRARPEHLLLKVPNVKFDFDVSVDSRHCLTDTLKSNSTLGTHLHAMIRAHHFDFEVKF